MRTEIGRIPHTKQVSAEYGKKLNAKATVAEAKALGETAAIPAIMVARFAVFVSFVSFAVSCLTLWIVIVRRS